MLGRNQKRNKVRIRKDCNRTKNSIFDWKFLSLKNAIWSRINIFSILFMKTSKVNCCHLLSSSCSKIWWHTKTMKYWFGAYGAGNEQKSSFSGYFLHHASLYSIKSEQISLNLILSYLLMSNFLDPIRLQELVDYKIMLFVYTYTRLKLFSLWPNWTYEVEHL